ncbi:MAG: uncharacterized protein JWR83_1611 [Aeromicrobium sp.]|nr:uncharacterized protein [Aeromicrobium sp.]
MLLGTPKPSPVFATYWRFAAERQSIYRQRIEGMPAPWTDDDVLRTYRFTNVYRASDRVSQYLIQNVIYQGAPDPPDVVLRVLLFKLFNRVSTWELLTRHVGTPTVSGFDVEQYRSILDRAFNSGERLYSAAYIMPPAFKGAERKHDTHLRLVRMMLDTRLVDRLVEAPSMHDAYELLLSYPGVGPFLAYQLVIDLNYSDVLEFSEMEFVKAGPGALSGLRKCFDDAGGHSPEDLIRWTADRQGEEFDSQRLDFRDLWGRPLQLIDCQNLYCEVDKYARVVHPEASGPSTRSRIKQRFRPAGPPPVVWFPPKWNINDRVPASSKPERPLGQVCFNYPTAGITNGAEHLVASQDRLFPLVESTPTHL